MTADRGGMAIAVCSSAFAVTSSQEAKTKCAHATDNMAYNNTYNGNYYLTVYGLK